MSVGVECAVGDVPKDLVCCRCGRILHEPRKVACGHCCCAVCLDRGSKKGICLKCSSVISPCQEATPEGLLERLGQLSICCPRGCGTFLTMERLAGHGDECVHRMVTCRHRGCEQVCRHKEVGDHEENCEFRPVKCEVCDVTTAKRDMAAHQAVKKCFEKQMKRNRVTSARKLSSDLKDHRLTMVQHRHLTDQMERSLLRDHYERQKSDYVVERRRAHSAGPVSSRQSIQSRVGSALVMKRNVSMTSALSCMNCESKFLSGRRPSARRHSHTKVPSLLC